MSLSEPFSKLIFETNSCNYYELKPDGYETKIFAQLLKDTYPSLEELVYLKNDFELTCKSKLSGILSAYQMIQTEAGFAIYKEYFDGIPLGNFLLNWKFNVPQFLNLAIKLTKLVKELHQQNLIVKEFIIENILINPETQELKICCLGAASKLLRERLEYTAEFNYYGSLWHIAPEQTGRIGRTLDYRTDFYSLGILFYQMLCNRRPFNYTDSLELIHAHIAKNPVEPRHIVKDIPDPINGIVIKLMSKNAEDRYQSESGILEDLNRCLKEWQKTGKLDTFSLGQDDRSNIFTISEKLYGRKKEIGILSKNWEKIKNNDFAFLVVAGYSGIGKTRLISEIRKTVFEDNGYFVSGKFDQLNRETPYSAFIYIIKGLIQSILAESEEKLEKWKEILNSQTDDDISVICDLIPELHALVNKDVIPVNLGPIEGKKRLNKAVLFFFSIFDKMQKPIALLIDDLQWADSASLDLLSTIFSSDLKNILLLGAYRDNEVDSAHPFIMCLESLKSIAPEKIQEIFLKDLQFEDINQLIADSLQMSSLSTQQLTDLIMNKTHGNPFFVKEFLKKLVEDGRVYFSNDVSTWLWDIENIRNLDISDYVVDLLLKKMSKLTTEAQRIISLAACIGTFFDIETLCTISSTNQKSISELLWEIMKGDFINPIGQWSKQNADAEWDNISFIQKINYHFRFQHDRIQQAAYSFIKEDDRTKTHYEIGNILMSKMPPNELDENLFEVLNHINYGRHLIHSEEEKLKIANLNLKAAKKALKNNVIRPASNYYKIGMELIEENQDVEIFKDLLIGQSECEYLLGDYEASEELFNKALKNADSNLNKADILCRKMALYENGQRHEKAIDTAREGLKLLGMDLPVNTNQFHVLKELLTVKFLLRNKTTEQLLNNKKLESPEKIIIMKILMNLWGPVYLLQKQELLAFKILRMVNISIRYGNSIESALAYAFYGYVISAQLKDYKTGCEFAKMGMDLNIKLNDKSLRSKVIVIAEGCVAHWGRPYNVLNASLREAYNVGVESNDIIYAGYATSFMNRNHFFSGEELERVLQKSIGYFQFVFKINSIISYHQMLPWARLVCDLSDKFPPSNIFKEFVLEDDHLNHLLKLNEDLNLQLPLANYYTTRSMYHYIMNDSEMALEIAKKADPLMLSVMGLNEWAEQIIYKTLSLLSLMITDHKVSKKDKKAATNSIKLMKKWAENSPKNYESKYLLALAEFSFYTKKYKEATAYYLHAIKSANESGVYYLSGLIHEKLAAFYSHQNETKLAQSSIHQAIFGYQQWGAIRKVEQLKVKFKFLITDNVSAELSSKRISSSALDLQSILEAAQTLSGEVNFEKLLEKMLLVLIKNAGAQNAYLIRSKSNELFVEATSEMINGNICNVQQIKLENVLGISQNIVKKVFKSKETIIVNDVNSSIIYKLDDQIKAINTKSILCMPIVSKGNIIALIYLDNRLSSDVFTTERLELLQILSGQIAISLENAELYQNLEQKVKERTIIIEDQKIELEASKQKTESLLLNILPDEIAEELKTKGKCLPRRYEAVTIMFTDFEKFTDMSKNLTPEEIVEIVDYQYKAFDLIIEKYKIEKIKTMGDSYMCVSGLPNVSEDHAEKAVDAACEIAEFVANYSEERKAKNLPYCNIRIGLNSGPVVAGVVGYKKFAFDIWGDSVNTASRMQTAGEPRRINISNTTYDLVKDSFECEYRGKIEAKYKGEIDMYFVNKKIERQK